MKVNIGSILEVRGGTVPFQGQQEIAISDEQLGLKLTKPVAVNGTITNTGKGFLVQADLSFEYQVNCGRCLESYNTSGQVLVQEQFLPGNPHHETVSAPVENDPVYQFKGDVLDLSDCLREQIYLALPMSFVCRPDCRGFCAGCGRNLNQQDCTCTEEIVDTRFEKLKSLLNTEGGGSDGKPKK